jgi:hypothetical protein
MRINHNESIITLGVDMQNEAKIYEALYNDEIVYEVMNQHLGGAGRVRLKTIQYANNTAKFIFDFENTNYEFEYRVW